MTITSKQVKETLKGAGIPTNKIGVKVRQSRYAETYIHITIKDLNINISDIEKVASESFEHLDYCPASGEILQGCNTYTLVSYDGKLYHDTVLANVEEAQKILENIDANQLYGTAVYDADGVILNYFPKDKMASLRKNGEALGRFTISTSYELAEALVKAKIA